MSRKPKYKLISVTARDIRLGWRTDTCLCPVARAARRVFKGIVYVANDIYCVKNKRRYSLNTAARRFINHFDAGVPVKPFAFKTREKVL